MAHYEYKIASGFDVANGSMTYFESIFTGQQRKSTTPPLPRGGRVPIGSITRVALDGTRYTDGARLARLFYSVVAHADLATYMTTYIGSWTADYGSVTVKLRNPDGTFTRYNAYAYSPLVNGEPAYSHVNSAWVANLELQFRIIGAAA